MKIGVIGGGTVGRATARCWLEHAEEVMVFDVDPKRSTVSDDLARVMELSNLIFICLPEDKIESFLSGSALGLEQSATFKVQCQEANFVIKSTVPVGTTRKLRDKYGLVNLCHSPEFLTERCAVTDAQMPAQLIIGRPDTHDADGDCYQLWLEVHRKRFPGVPIYDMSSDESELVKLIVNAFAATKVSFFNEMRSLSDALGLDWQRVIEGVLGDGRIGHSWTKVPGPDGKRGFGGKCLPKDLLMLIESFRETRREIPDLSKQPLNPILNAVQARNSTDRKEQG